MEGDEPWAPFEAGGPDDRVEEALDLISNQSFIRGQTLRAAVELGLLDALTDGPIRADAIAADRGLDAENTYRLLRGLAHHGVVEEDENRRFSLTPVGEYFRSDHPQSVRDAVLLFWHPDRLAAFTHLSDIVREGGPTGYEREFGKPAYEHVDQNPALADTFDGTMTLFSQLAAPEVLAALDGYDFSQISKICDVGGGQGYLLCRLLAAHDHLEGTVLERPEVVEEEADHWAPELDVEDRCTYVAGDMFEAVPAADAYFLKNVLQDWSDEECVEILSTIRRSAPADASVFIVKRLLPSPGETGPAIPSDIHMMAVTGGRERTEAEYQALLNQADWTFVKTWNTDEGGYSVIEATIE